MKLNVTIEVKNVEAFDGNPREILSVSALELDQHGKAVLQHSAEVVIDPTIPGDLQKRFALRGAFHALGNLVEDRWDKTGLL